MLTGKMAGRIVEIEARLESQPTFVTIRKMVKIRQMDPAWSLRRHVEQNPLAWTVRVNGFVLDARMLKREIQEEALRKELIPYIPERPRPFKDDVE